MLPKEPARLRVFVGPGFLEFSVITIDIVEKTNLIFLVYRSGAVDNQNRNSGDEVHLKIVFLAVHRGLDTLQIPAGVIAQHPGDKIGRILDANASMAEIADVLREQSWSICPVQVYVLRIREDDLPQAQRVRFAGLLPHHQVKRSYAF